MVDGCAAGAATARGRAELGWAGLRYRVVVVAMVVAIGWPCDPPPPLTPYLYHTFSRHGMINAAVLPVPFLARASTFRFCRMIGIDLSCTGDGLSNPFSKIPARRTR